MHGVASCDVIIHGTTGDAGSSSFFLAFLNNVLTIFVFRRIVEDVSKFACSTSCRVFLDPSFVLLPFLRS